MATRHLTTPILLLSLGGILGFATLRYGGTDFVAWNISLAAIGFLGLVFLVTNRSRSQAPPVDRFAALCTALLFAFVLLQLVPLPLGVLEIISPARAELARALSVVSPQSAAPISIMPARTGAYLGRMFAFILMYLLVRELGWRLRQRLWLVAAPPLAIGLIEAVIGIWQIQTTKSPVSAVGTYLNRDLYGGLLAMLTPVAVLWVVRIAATGATQRAPLATIVARTLPGGLLVLALLAGLTRSLSRMAVASAAASLAVAALFYLSGHGRHHWRPALAGILGVVVLAAAFAPGKLFTRYAELNDTSRLDAGRMPIWQETLIGIERFPVVGCGLGCRKTAYLADKTAMPNFATDYAHSDYLQALQELGFIGFGIASAAAWFIFREVARAARKRHDLDAQTLALGCTAGMAALAIHSLVDFNLHQPSSALMFAWLAGMGSATAVAPTRREDARDVVINLVRTA